MTDTYFTLTSLLMKLMMG